MRPTETSADTGTGGSLPIAAETATELGLLAKVCGAALSHDAHAVQQGGKADRVGALGERVPARAG